MIFLEEQTGNSLEKTLTINKFPFQNKFWPREYQVSSIPPPAILLCLPSPNPYSAREGR